MNIKQRQITVVLLTGSSISHNPRALKEASALARAGFRVRVLGAWLDPMLKAMDQHVIPDLAFEFVPVLDLTERRLIDQVPRIRRRSGVIAHTLVDFENRWQLGYSYTYLKRAALREQADLFIVHSEPALAVGADLHRAGRRVGIDMEDWFSEDLLPETRRHRPLKLLRSLEETLLAEGVFASCPSRAMSDALAAAYDCPRPTVIYNAFAWNDRKFLDGSRRDRRDQNLVSVHWFSQTLGPGRGLEQLFESLPLMSRKFEIHLRGRVTGDFERWLRSNTPDAWADQVFLHELVENSELLSRIAEHDIGFAGEQLYCLNKDLTISNKILYYLLGGLAVAASSTEGQREVANQAPDAVFLYPSGDPQALANVLNSFLVSPERLLKAKSRAVQAARATFCWEQQEPLLVEAVSRSARAPC